MDSRTYQHLRSEAIARGEKFSIFDFKPRKCTQMKMANHYFMVNKKTSKFYRKKKRWIMKLRKKLNAKISSIISRCTQKGCNGYKYYGGRGIKTFITVDELEFLWHRDYAANMKHPSIDRIDNDGNYELSNCRFMEWEDNNRRRFNKNNVDGKYKILVRASREEQKIIP